MDELKIEKNKEKKDMEEEIKTLKSELIKKDDVIVQLRQRVSTAIGILLFIKINK